MSFEKKILVNKNIVISENSKTFIIAEIGSNHNQSFQQAKKLILQAKKCGADAVKFQSLNLTETIHSDEINETTKKLYKKISLNENWYKKLNNFSKKNKIIFFSTPTYSRSVKILSKLKVPIYKIASTNFGFNPKIDIEIAKQNKPILISTGLVTTDEATNYLKNISNYNKKIILLHCISRYPTLDFEANLGNIRKLKEQFDCLVGFSDHTMSTDIPAYAVAAGARVIEKHFTLSKSHKGPDHFYALNPKEFSEMCIKIRKMEAILNLNSNLKKFKKEEIAYKKYFKLKIFSNKDLKKGQRVNSKNLVGLINTKNKGIDCREIFKLKSFICKKNIKKNTLLEWKNLIKKK